MKTKMLHFAAALSAAALLGPVALAGQDHPIKRQSSSPATSTDCCLMQESCKDASCCDTKMSANAAPGGKASHSSFKKVRACTSTCKLDATDKAAVCKVNSK